MGYGDLVDVVVPDGSLRRGRVVSLSEKAVLVQVFAGTDDLVPATPPGCASWANPWRCP